MNLVAEIWRQEKKRATEDGTQLVIKMQESNQQKGLSEELRETLTDRLRHEPTNEPTECISWITGTVQSSENARPEIAGRFHSKVNYVSHTQLQTVHAAAFIRKQSISGVYFMFTKTNDWCIYSAFWAEKCFWWEQWLIELQETLTMLFLFHCMSYAAAE